MLRSSAAALGAALALAAPAAARAADTPLPAAPYDEAGYWAFADRMQSRVDAGGGEQAG
jgi:hypothetical protein